MQFSWIELLNFFSFHKDTPWDFVQPTFWAFFFVIITIYSLIYKNIPFRNFFLLITSLFFYYKSGGLYFWLLIFSIFTDFYYAIFIEKAQQKLWKFFWLLMSLSTNLLILAYYKYAY
ncbi:MAG: MBOAT family protein, partial [Thermonemataceae bacterium]|nr:MBOAT family protein [Thermonemataceae bacterium]